MFVDIFMCVCAYIHVCAHTHKAWKININTAPEIKKKSVYIQLQYYSSVSCPSFRIVC